jgi:exosortase
MTTAPASTIPRATDSPATDSWKVLLPYGLAVLAQLPMLMLYFKQLWGRPHYQPFAIAILATVGIALYRWPFNQRQPFHRSISSDILLVLGLGFAALGFLFVEPWFAAASVMLIVTSLFARTIDRESLKTLWPCALPLFVYLTLPNGLDVRLITKLQQYSAVYTSKLLDLAGLGHHMDGTVIKVPVLGEYGIEQACSGVQSFFTLLLVAVVFIVMSRRLKVPGIGVGVVSVFAAFLCFVLRSTVLSMPIWNEVLLLAGIGFLIHAFIGFRATVLILSAVFWAVFMNTMRIMLIPLADHFLDFDLSHGIYHDILGYTALALGIAMLFSTDQFLLFLFGPVEASGDGSGEFGNIITRFWNRVLSGSNEDDETPRRKKKKRERMPVSRVGRAFIWVAAGLMIAMGLFQLVDVQKSYAQSDLAVRFFDNDVTVDFEKTDIPETVDTWKMVHHETQDRSIGSDLGQRSDVWNFRSPTCAAVASMDQTFPGWHELTTCYTNTGWKLTKRTRKLPSQVLGEPASDDEWAYIEATFEKSTGEKGYLLFSHFDAFGEGLDAPDHWGTVNSFIIRARNRMSHRVRASLFHGEAYQSQVFLTSFNELSDDVKQEANERYLKIREQLRTRFIEKKKQEEAGEAT